MAATAADTDALKDAILKCFRKADLNDSGLIEKEELGEVLRGIGFPALKVSRLLSMMHTNADNKIRYEDLVSWSLDDTSAGSPKTRVDLSQQVRVRVQSLSGEEMAVVMASLDETVMQLKQRLSDAASLGIPFYEQELVNASGALMNNGSTLAECGVSDPEVSLTLVRRAVQDVRLSIGCGSGHLYIYEGHSGGLLRKLRPNSSGVLAVAFSPSKQQFAYADRSGGYHIIDADSGKAVKSLELDLFRGASENQTSPCVAYSQDGERIALGATHGLWIAETTSGELLHHVKFGSWAKVMAYAPNGERAVVGLMDGQLQAFEAASGQRLRDLPVADQKICSLAYAPDSKVVACGTLTGDLLLLDVDTAVVQRIANEDAGCKCIAHLTYAPNGERVGAGTIDGSFKMFDAASGTLLRQVKIAEETTCLAFAPNSDQVLIGGLAFNVFSLKLFDLVSGAVSSITWETGMKATSIAASPPQPGKQAGQILSMHTLQSKTLSSGATVDPRGGPGFRPPGHAAAAPVAGRGAPAPFSSAGAHIVAASRSRGSATAPVAGHARRGPPLSHADVRRGASPAPREGGATPPRGHARPGSRSRR